MPDPVSEPVDWLREFRARSESYASERGRAPRHAGAVERAAFPGDTYLEARLNLVRSATEATLVFLAEEMSDNGSWRKLEGVGIDKMRGHLRQLPALKEPDSGWRALEKTHLDHLQRLGNHASHHNDPLPEAVHPAALAHLGAVALWVWDAVGIAPVEEPPPPPTRSRGKFRLLLLVSATAAVLAAAALALGLFSEPTTQAPSTNRKVAPALEQADPAPKKGAKRRR